MKNEADMEQIYRFSDLPDYAFPRLRKLLSFTESSKTEVPMHIGEPTHEFPDFVKQKVLMHSDEFNRYPPNEGTPGLLKAISLWLTKRYSIPELDPEKNIMVLNGTREGLFNAAIALSPRKKNGNIPAVIIPNPFYQCYMVAARAAGAEPIFVPASSDRGFLPDFTELPTDILNRTTVCYICSPSNPQGAIATKKYWSNLFALAETFDFKILADECYSEIYRNEIPSGALESLFKLGANPERLIVFNSLSKRSNLPGLRCGFAAGHEKTIAELKKLKSYSGAPCPTPLQHAAEAAWSDEIHVKKNRMLYTEKLNLADNLLKDVCNYKTPQAGFFLWLPVPDDEKVTMELWKNFGVKVLPGSYLSNENHSMFESTNPGKNFIRVALVNSKDQVEFGLRAIAKYLS